MSISYYSTFPCLSKNFCKTYNFKAFRFNNILQNISWANTCKLINVSNKNQSCSNSYSFQKRMHQKSVYHRHFIYNNNICFQWILFVSSKLCIKFRIITLPTWYFKHSVNSLCLMACSLSHTLCGTSRWSRKTYF